MKGKIFTAPRGAKKRVKCKCCKEEFEARVADIKRGWGKFCSKSCKAREQEKRTGQNSEFLRKKEYALQKEDYETIEDLENFAGARFCKE